jgi:hypothetical protein
MLQGSSGDSLAKLCVSKLATFIQDADQNRGPRYFVFLFPTEFTFVLFFSVKYIALLAMAKIVPTHPHLITEYQDTIFTSINDQDISIRMRALDLLSAMVNLIFGMLENTAYKRILDQSWKSTVHCPAVTRTPCSRLFVIIHSCAVPGSECNSLQHLQSPTLTKPISCLSLDAISTDIESMLSIDLRECRQLRMVHLSFGRFGPCGEC